MRRRMLTAALAAFGLTLLAGCGGGGGSGSALPTDPGQVSGSVTMWIYPINEKIESTYWAPVVSAFTKQYPKAKVDVVVQPWANRDEQLTTAIAGGKGPDVIYMIPDQIPQYASIGSLTDMSDVLTADKADYRPNALKAMTYQDKPYGVPVLMSVTSIVAHRTVLAKAGISSVPTTWADMLADGAKLKKAGLYLTDYNGAPDETLNQTFYPILWQAGGDVVSADGKLATLDTPEAASALSFLKQLVDNGYVPKDSLTTTTPGDQSVLCTNKAAMAFSDSVSDVSTCPNFDASEWAVGAPLKNKVQIGYGTAGGLSVLSGSKNIGTAKAWVKFVSGKDQQAAFSKAQIYSSPRLSQTDVLKGQPLLGDSEQYLSMMKTGVTNVPAPRALMDVIKPHIQAALLGKVSVQAALAAAQSDADKQLAKGS